VSSTCLHAGAIDTYEQLSEDSEADGVVDQGVASSQVPSAVPDYDEERFLVAVDEWARLLQNNSRGRTWDMFLNI
jgi:hypothetical protein